MVTRLDRRNWALGGLFAVCCRKRYQSERGVRYASHPEAVLDVYFPGQKRERATGVVAIHGGGWREGSREESFPRLCIRYLNEGCVVANVDYRLAPKHPAPAALEDVRSAVAWFRERGARWGVDPKRIVLTGESAGGHLAMMASDGAAAVVSFAGITDVWELVEGPHAQEFAAQWIPPGPSRRALAMQMSPLEEVREGFAPTYLVHNEGDPVVPFSQAARMAAALQKFAVPCHLEALPDKRHSVPEQQLERLYTGIFAWLRKQQLLN